MSRIRNDITLAGVVWTPWFSFCSTAPRLELHCGRSVVLAAIVRRQVIDRGAATKLPSAASGLLDGHHHPGRHPALEAAARRTATHRSTQATSANIAYAAGEVLRVGAYAVIVLHLVGVVEERSTISTTGAPCRVATRAT